VRTSTCLHQRGFCLAHSQESQESDRNIAEFHGILETEPMPIAAVPRAHVKILNIALRSIDLFLFSVRRVRDRSTGLRNEVPHGDERRSRRDQLVGHGANPAWIFGLP
jgi:hypothetical protein